jgi:hypothetical protein
LLFVVARKVFVESFGVGQEVGTLLGRLDRNPACRLLVTADSISDTLLLDLLGIVPLELKLLFGLTRSDRFLGWTPAKTLTGKFYCGF